jgi:hypothetical protein
LALPAIFKNAVMKTLLLIITLALAQKLFAQQQDSTDIKLNQYKLYFDKGLINQEDYDLLRAKLLHIGKFASKRNTRDANEIMQYDRKTTFEIRIEPLAFFGVRTIYNEPFMSSNGKVYYGKQVIPNQQYGGIHFAIGAAFKKQYHLHFTMGYDGNQREQFFTAGGDFNMNLLSGRFSPFIHAGAGYASIEGNNEGAILPWETIGPLTGCYAVSGIGLYARLTKFFAITVSPDYRFMYGFYKDYIDYYNLFPGEKESYKIFYHQLGIRIAAVFY